MLCTQFIWNWHFWRRRFLNFFSVFLLFRYYLPLENDSALHLKKKWVPFMQWCFWLILAQWFWRKRWICEKFTTRTITTTTDIKLWSEKLIDITNFENSFPQAQIGIRSHRLIGISIPWFTQLVLSTDYNSFPLIYTTYSLGLQFVIMIYFALFEILKAFIIKL